MIAKVRIAPVERWCAGSLRDGEASMAGRIVAIDTNSMQVNTDEDTGEKFRSWKLVGKDLKWLKEILGDPVVDALCEHMLEMD